MILTQKLGAECFLENINLFANPKTEPEKYNLYMGLKAMSDTMESLLHYVHKLEKQLDLANQKLDDLSRRLPPKNRI